MGRIAGLASSLDSRPTPIAKEIIRFVNYVNITAIIIGLILFIIALMMGCYWLDAIIFMIGLLLILLILRHSKIFTIILNYVY